MVMWKSPSVFSSCMSSARPTDERVPERREGLVEHGEHVDVCFAQARIDCLIFERVAAAGAGLSVAELPRASPYGGQAREVVTGFHQAP